MTTVRELNLACEERDTLIVLADIRRQQRLELQKQIADLEEFSGSQERTVEGVYGRIESMAETHASWKISSGVSALCAIESKLIELARELKKAKDSNEWLASQTKTDAAAIADRDRIIEGLRANRVQP